MYLTTQKADQYQPPNQAASVSGGGGLGPAGVLLDERVPGVVKWYNFKNGFGFVTRYYILSHWVYKCIHAY